ncbi:leucyl aminopeptidase family protein [Rhodoflexus caldus]|uniref:leucyl aminopeptidase family protein n=1 Tax=Rhodoflexus caldus TaxID=2891236 RepID=UPI00202A8296|nr:leucyl aminopeptidase family protein [Rhodoflexus caldus]
MQVKILHTGAIENNADLAVLMVSSPEEAFAFCSGKPEYDYLVQKAEKGDEVIVLNQWMRKVYCIAAWNQQKGKQLPDYERLEKIRRGGNRIAKLMQEDGSTQIQLTVGNDETAALLALAEGIALGSYQFLNYQPAKQAKQQTPTIYCYAANNIQPALDELSRVTAANFLVRDLVNEPPMTLTIQELSARAIAAGQEAGFEVEVLHKAQIEALRMNGLLTVNKGSATEPAFNILTYKPANAVNAKPLVLVGKGIVYDTGGYSIKTSEGMETMKCDMGGAAAVIGALTAIASNKLPVYVVGLIPSTDNRISSHAYVPGDIITYANGKSVEVLNTDAEGRLILADALIYAQKYEPQLVIDLATLTGAAMRAIGREACVMMGTAPDEVKQRLIASGRAVYERIVEFPLWDDYDQYIKSEIADIKNTGIPEAGAITAGKFLEHFTAYDWIHLDIAGPTFIKSADHYRGPNGTGYGARLLYDFVKGFFA